jgi:pimeloyl-ACP methyl ester carboxylesterase
MFVSKSLFFAMEPLSISEFESFYVGGTVRQVEQKLFGRQNQVSGAMYVQRLVPKHRRFPFPVVFIHGGMHTGVTRETTPDGRDGWQTLFARAGFETLVIDQAWRGRSAPDLSGLNPALELQEHVGPAFTCGYEIGMHFAREGGRFSDGHWKHYGSQLWPDFGVPSAMAEGTPGRSDPRALPPLVELIDRLGLAVLVTHSQGGHLGWQATLARPQKVAAIIAIEPGQTCPGLDDPAFPDIPVRLVWGDNLAETGAALTISDVQQAKAIATRRPRVSVDWLPENDIKGNGHMLMMEDNNAEIAARLQAWLLQQFPSEPLQE